jgi:hypothetical protein
VTRRLLGALVATLFGVVAAGCFRPSPVGYFDRFAYYPSRSHYRVLFAGAEDSREVASAGWVMSDFARDDGRPTTAMASWGRLQRFEYDPESTGRISYVLDERSDLSLLHDDGSRIETWTQPVSRVAAGRDLADIVVGIVISGIRNRPITATIAEHARVLIDGETGHQVFFELADATPGPSGVRVIPLRACLIAVRPMRRWVPGGSTADPGEGMSMFVFFFLTADADVFDARYADFEDLLRRVDFHE